MNQWISIKPRPREWLLASSAAILMTLQFAAGEFISHGWAYSRGGIEMVSGSFDSEGIDSAGFLEGISNVEMTIRTKGDQWTPLLAADDVSGWFSTLLRIPANGSSSGIELHFRAENDGFPAEFLMFQYPGLGGPFHSDLTFTDENYEVHTRTCENLSSLEWNLWAVPIGSKVADGGATLTMLAFPVAAFLLRFRWARERR
jgi:hypothetical protein